MEINHKIYNSILQLFSDNLNTHTIQNSVKFFRQHDMLVRLYTPSEKQKYRPVLPNGILNTYYAVWISPEYKEGLPSDGHA